MINVIVSAGYWIFDREYITGRDAECNSLKTPIQLKVDGNVAEIVS